MIIAVDGPTASGKGTIAKALAAHFGLPHLDTGLLYRAVGRQVFLNSGNPDDAADALAACTFDAALLDDPELRTEVSGGYASRVSIHPAVRAALFTRQQVFANQPGGAVLDGRDIATVIAPQADAKLFITATVSARAMRRWAEMKGLGVDVDRTEIEADLEARDTRDRNRAEAPLRQADGAELLDTSRLTKEMAVATAIALVEKQVTAKP
ncbi:cytidylate kinase [Novosphingobium sp. AAP83]|uniref:(d)CMP kinase n=1 Tax=Novosphingobium sp. AAP83 TaxID=1523425 RepID=UPI0006B94D80|nr:(d)CMP kinase [Novosphingobium sp. AAP83]KPF92050.1 cytidylate kinase [Novosphingobium sp. AAP83]